MSRSFIDCNLFYTGAIFANSQTQIWAVTNLGLGVALNKRRCAFPCTLALLVQWHKGRVKGEGAVAPVRSMLSGENWPTISISRAGISKCGRLKCRWVCLKRRCTCTYKFGWLLSSTSAVDAAQLCTTEIDQHLVNSSTSLCPPGSDALMPSVICSSSSSSIRRHRAVLTETRRANR